MDLRHALARDGLLRECKWHDIEAEDDVTAYLEYPGGATGVFVTTTGEAPGTNRFEVCGDLGKLVSEHGRLTLYRNRVGTREHREHAWDNYSTPEYEVIEVETDGQNTRHVGVLNAFAANILRGEPLVAAGQEGIRGLTLSNAMHLSAWLKRPVDLPLDEALFLAELDARRATSRHKDGESVYITANGSTAAEACSGK